MSYSYLTPEAEAKLERLRRRGIQSDGLISELELIWLLTLFSKENNFLGNIIEIGTHVGHTTAWLSSEFPNNLIYTVDCVGRDLPNKFQSIETPPWNEVGIHCRFCQNVVFINGNTQDHRFSFPRAQGAFIDGDHTYEGVKSDFEKLKQAGVWRYVFHDALPDPNNSWIGVHKFLQELCIRANVHIIPYTRLAIVDHL